MTQSTMCKHLTVHLVEGKYPKVNEYTLCDTIYMNLQKKKNILFFFFLAGCPGAFKALARLPAPSARPALLLEKEKYSIMTESQSVFQLAEWNSGYYTAMGHYGTSLSNRSILMSLYGFDYTGIHICQNVSISALIAYK